MPTQILAEQYNISNLMEMIEQVKQAVSQWRHLAQQYEIKTVIIHNLR
jgi:N-dimethylarginine dimethylaminohydrolase